MEEDEKHTSRTCDSVETDPVEGKQEEVHTAASAESSAGKELVLYSKAMVIVPHDSCRAREAEGAVTLPPRDLVELNWDADWAWSVDYTSRHTQNPAAWIQYVELLELAMTVPRAHQTSPVCP